MSKRVVFKDGHVEEIIRLHDVSCKDTKRYRIITKSGIYLCEMYPNDLYVEDLKNTATRQLSLVHRAYKVERECDDIVEIDDIDCPEVIPDTRVKSETKPSRISVDDYYLNIAKAVCKRSTCMRRHYGAVIVKNGEIISTGYNGSPRGEDNCCDTGVCGREGNAHNDGDYRKCPAVHAEMNALLSAARKDTIGATLYLYGEDADGSVIDASPCPICDALIHNSGIENIVASNANWSCD